MMTQSHLIFGMTAFGRAGSRKVTAASLIGAFIPDLSLYLLAGWQLLWVGTSPDIVFGEMYFSEEWHSIFRIDNSIILWGIALGLSVMLRAPVAIALCGAALLHLFLDLPFHHDDGRAHFWPMTNWIFESPLSYWDRNHHGDLVSTMEILLALSCCVILWRRFADKIMRSLILLLAALGPAPPLLFNFIFAAG